MKYSKNKTKFYTPIRMRFLNGTFTVFAWRSEFRIINENFFIDIKTSSSQSKDILTQFIITKRLFGNICETLCMNVICFDSRNKSSITRNGCIFRFNRVLKELNMKYRTVKFSICWLVHVIFLPGKKTWWIDGSSSIVVDSITIEIIALGHLKYPSFLRAHKLQIIYLIFFTFLQ